MNLPGRLRLTTLGDVLGALHRASATGVLELVDSSGGTHTIRVADGLVREVESAFPGTRIGDLLKQRGAVEPASPARLSMWLGAATGRRWGDLLVAVGAATQNDVIAAVRAQYGERLERLYRLSDARLAFRVARREVREAFPTLGPEEFLVGRARARDRGQPGVAQGRRHDPVRTRALATLGLTPGADRASVQRAFRSLAARLHPDRFPAAGPADRAAIVQRFAELSAAYHSLVA
jgi:hypothetical protein